MPTNYSFLQWYLISSADTQAPSYDDEAYWRYLVDVLRRNPGLLPEWDRVQKNVMDLISPEYRAQVNAALAELKSGVVKADS